jgi:PAS domain S-box-containing protein
MSDMQKEYLRVIELCRQRTALLKAIGELNAVVSEQGQDEILERCCDILIENINYCLVWAGTREGDDNEITPIAVADSVAIADRDCMKLIKEVVLDMHDTNPAALALQSGSPVIIQDIFQEDENSPLLHIARETGFRSCLSWPLTYKDREYGVLTIHSEQANCFKDSELDFLSNVMADVSLALYSQETTKQLQVERDFNQELVDTVQGLLVSIAPCGKILSMNREAEKVTGYDQRKVVNKYWVDVLLSPEERQENQRRVSEALKNHSHDVNFQASLQTRAGERRIIDWHGSFRTNIDKGQVGWVLFGIDKTRQIDTDRTLSRVLAKWEHIFISIQDPALIVSIDSRILDANPATLAAARKTREEVIGRQLCQILHGGSKVQKKCPLEELVKVEKTRIIETELQGLRGKYMLTISPLFLPEQEDIRLLVARNLDEEELSRAEQMRAAQLASIGELAAGVAHEINNPINGIINFAQLLLDDLGNDDSSAANAEILRRIISEGARIGSIAHKLLDFARGHEVEFEPVKLNQLVNDCLALIGHQLKKDGIVIEIDISEQLPEVFCSKQQMEQVLLNIFSNARYALNKKFNKADPGKKIRVSAAALRHNLRPYIALTITDYGTGIEHDLMERLFDPFFSTKPKGEGTGLGLSISHGLVQDNNGFLRVQSEFGKYTSLVVGLPTQHNEGGTNDR